MSRLVTSIQVLTACLLLPVTVADDARIEFFESKIRPVLTEHCYSCHAMTAKNVRGGLLIDSRVGIAAGGDSGDLLVPGDPDDSLLISALRHESFEMPPDRKLPENVIKNFETWIRDGAVDPRQDGVVLDRRQIDMEEGRKFWSFQTINQPIVPDVAATWSKTDVDKFVAAKHIDSGLAVAGDATPAQLVRRLYFVLIGLPPTPAQIQNFTADWQINPDDAIEDVAEELLASPRFGERWGRHWLDVVRFAESSGGGRSLMFPDAWRFRDYVIKSFNNDKPIDQLIKEHIAGDLLPSKDTTQADDQITGTGFLALGPTNYELQDKQLLQMEVIDEQIDTVGRAFLGLTIGCARCHDHKFDPIPTADYYALAGIFRSTESLLPGNVSNYVTTKLTAGKAARYFAEWKVRQAELKTEIAGLKQADAVGPPVEKFLDVDSLPGLIIDDDEAIFVGEWKTSTMIAPFVGKGYRHNQFDPKGKSVRFETNLPDGEYEVRLCHNYQGGRSSRVPVAVHHAEGQSTVIVDQSQRPVDGVFASLGYFRFHEDKAAVVSINTEEADSGVVIVDALQFLPRDASSAVESELEEQRRRKRLAELNAELEDLQKQKLSPPQVMSVRDSKTPADGHIHVRGSVRNPGDMVPRGFVTVAGEFDSEGNSIRPIIPPSSSGRRELAVWTASANNPLTSRVFVNRVWQHVMGEGIVRTPDNFGAMGQLPTHPELLDHLAWTFTNNDKWSVKSLINRLVCSKTFRLSVDSTAASKLDDPDNRLLGRGFRRRFDAESIRDSLLKISGQLNTAIIGNTIAKISQYDNGYDHETHSKNMRSVFVPFFRNSMLEIFDVYDIANPNLVTGRRHTSTLPAQALFMLNSPFVQQCARAAAEQFLENDGASEQTTEQQIREVSLLCLGRMPTNDESQMLEQFVDSSTGEAEDVWTSVFQAMFSSLDFRFLD